MNHSSHIPTAHINLDHICSNYRRLCDILAADGLRDGPAFALPGGDCDERFTWPPIVPVIKSDAYGHGHIKVAHALLSREDVSIFASGHVPEAVELRQGLEETAAHSDKKPHGSSPLIISLLGPMNHHDLECCAACSIIPAIHSFEQLSLLESLKKTLPVAIKCNTGMARLGFNAAEMEYVIKRLQALPKAVPVLALSHLAKADSEEAAANIRVQAETFAGMLKKLRKNWPNMAVSLCNSAGMLQSRIATDIIGQHICRPGITLYGSNPLHGTTLASLGEGFKPAMAVSAPVIATRTLMAGDGFGYGHAFVAGEKMRIGIIAAGYADYLSRALSNRGFLCAAGVRIRVLGRVSMQMTAVDLSDLSEISVGEKVWLLGGPYDTAVRPEELAEALNTISYELLCLMGANTRIYE